LDLAIALDENGEVADLAVDYVAPKGYLASMDLFVISKELLKKLVRECIARNLYHMDRDLILGSWQQGKISLNVYQFGGIAMFNETVEEYLRNSLALINKDIRQDLFYRNHTVYTKVRDRVPSYYGEDCNINNCLVADGCMLEGNVSHSVLFRQVRVKEGCSIENCLIMNDTVVGENCQLKHVILDKDVVVRPGSKLLGTPANPIIIKRGEIV
jgi:glucose-1-phosphate adenylyltransferase